MCPALNNEFLAMAERCDPAGVAASRARGDNVWQYLCHKLGVGLQTWRRQGNAGWAWHGQGRLICGLMWCTGCAESQSDSPLGEINHGDRWWPIIFRDTPNSEHKPTYCPALAWQNARAWMGHESRLFEIPAGALDGDIHDLPNDLPGPAGVLPPLPTPLPPAPTPTAPPPTTPTPPTTDATDPTGPKRRRWNRSNNGSNNGSSSAGSSPPPSESGS